MSFYIPLEPAENSAGEMVGETERSEQEENQDTGPNSRADDDSPALASAPLILVAEDDRFGRATVKRMLEHKYRLEFAENGQEVVDKYFSVSPDIVLMDIMMPVMDGYRAFAEITKKCRGQRVPIIALTAKAMKDDRQKLLDHGFADYVSKPIDDETLIETIDKHIAVSPTPYSESRGSL